MRSKILSFDERIQETVEGRNTIRYGKGKTKPVAELCYHRTTNQPIVFLWLPLPSHRKSERMGRVRLWLKGNMVTFAGHVSEGFGKMKLSSEWKAMPKEKRPGNYYHQKYSPIHAGIYNKFLQQDFNNTVVLESLVDGGTY